jgi:type II secretory pathway pseudopilin PulG
LIGELLVSAALLGIVVLVTVPTMSWIMQEQRAAGRRQAALTEAENILDRLTAQKWEQITPALLAEAQLSETVRGQLPDAELSLDVQMPDDQPGAKRIALSLQWSNGAKPPSRPVRLTAWVYRNGRFE